MSRYRNSNGGRRFIYTLFNLSFQFCVVTTAGTAVTLCDVYSEGSRSKLRCGTDCPDWGFSCFHSVPEFTLRDGTWLWSPVPSKFFPMYLSHITHHSRLFSVWWRSVFKQATKNKRKSNVCSISVSFVVIQWAKCRQWLESTLQFLGLYFFQNPNSTSIWY